MNELKSVFEMDARSTLDIAVTVADRGSPVMVDMIPKYSPGPSLASSISDRVVKCRHIGADFFDTNDSLCGESSSSSRKSRAKEKDGLLKMQPRMLTMNYCSVALLKA